MRAVVIGAGLAGLSAADELRRGGADLVVLEARERVGGRVHSRELANGALVEMGAEFILPGCDAVRGLAERLGLGLWQKGMRYGRREPRGGIGTTPEALEEAMEVVDGALAAEENASGLSVRAFLDSLSIDPGAREVILARAEISSASSADQVPTGDLAGLAHIDDEPAPSVAGGNQRLATGLSAELGDAVRLGAAVERVAWDERGVRVATAGDEAEGDACVVAAPASVVGRIRFEPALPEPKRAALDRVRYGQAAKLFVPLRSEVASGAVMNVPERYWTWTATGAGDRVQPVVSAFAGSGEALERLRVAAGPDAWVDSLTALRPELDLARDGALLSTWADDEWAAGAYSVDSGPELSAALAELVGPLAFAGEHTADAPFNGLMEGAIRSGHRAAEQLLLAAGEIGLRP